MENIKKGMNEFYIGDSSEQAVARITFKPIGENTIAIDHTIVSEALQGRGIAKQLLQKMADYAREENLKIVPVCSYAKTVMTRGADYTDVLAQE